MPPQNETERQRRRQAEAQEHALQQVLAKASRSIQVWYSIGTNSTTTTAANANATTTANDNNPTDVSLKTQILEPPLGVEGSASITCLAVLSRSRNSSDEECYRFLVAGDAAGGIRLWKVQCHDNSLQFVHYAYYQLLPADRSTSLSWCAIVCLEALADGRLAISTERTNYNISSLVGGVTQIAIPFVRAVHILDTSTLLTDGANTIPKLQATLTGHSNKDAVICMRELPNGDLLTGGGKMDATLQLWSREQIQSAAGEIEIVHSEASETLTSVGYVFALAILPDAKEASNYFAVAAARYNTVKVII